MATRIRLQRHGKKGKPFFHLVAADSRAKRDGKFIEKLGTYNPTANPAVIDINFDATLTWVQNGAEMSDTARAILSYKGVLYKNHLLNGVKKGALTAEQVEERFNKWLADKEAKIDNKITGLANETFFSGNCVVHFHLRRVCDTGKGCSAIFHSRIVGIRQVGARSNILRAGRPSAARNKIHLSAYCSH